MTMGLCVRDQDVRVPILSLHRVSILLGSLGKLSAGPSFCAELRRGIARTWLCHSLSPNSRAVLCRPKDVG